MQILHRDDAIADALLKNLPPVLQGPRGLHPIFILLSVMLCSCTVVVKKDLESEFEVHAGIAVSFRREFCLVGIGDTGEKKVIY